MMSVIRISSGSYFCSILSISISVSSNLVFPLSDSWRFAFYFTLVDKAIWHFFSSTKLNWFLKEFLLRNSCNAQRGRENWGEGGTFFSGEKICSFSGMSCSKSNMILMKFLPPLLPPFFLSLFGLVRNIFQGSFVTWLSLSDELEETAVSWSEGGWDKKENASNGR